MLPNLCFLVLRWFGVSSGMMQSIQSYGRTLNKKLLCIAIASLLLPLGINGWRQVPSQAQYVPATNSTNTWQYASFPVENFQTYTSGYGYRTSPITGTRQFHRGLDLAAPLGSYVRNWWGGKVVALSDHTGCGTMITIQSGHWTHIYCHLMGSIEESSQGRYFIDREGGLILWLGQEVPSGARIGRVGMTGRTTGPHLHWELKYRGEYLDPALVLLEMYGVDTSRPKGTGILRSTTRLATAGLPQQK